jgi:hypothetical protein
MGEVATIGLSLAKTCFSGARGRRRGSHGSAQAASVCAGSSILQSIAALSGWPGGVRDGALLGAGVARAGLRGAIDAGAIREPESIRPSSPSGLRGRYGPQYRTRDCRLRGGMVRLLARAMAYEA